MRKLGACALVLVMIVSTLCANVANASPYIKYDFYFKQEKISTYPDVFRDRGTVMVPARMVLEALGYKVTYQSKTKSFTATNKSGQSKLTFSIDERQALMNTKKISLPVAPSIYKGTTYIPLQTIGSLSKSNVGHDAAHRSSWIGKKPDSFQNKGSDFRETKWGMSVSDVKRAEKAKIVTEQEMGTFDAIYYKTTINQLETMIMYAFFKKELVSSAYYFALSAPSNTDSLIEDYIKIQKVYQQKYGEILNGYDIYSTDGPDPTSYEEVVKGLEKGSVALISKWEFGDTTLELSLMKDDKKLQVKALYRGVKYTHFLDGLSDTNDI